MKVYVLLTALFVLFTLNASAQTQTVEKAVSVNASSYSWFEYNYEQTTTLSGRFRATGGNKNDIRVMIMDADSFENYKNGSEFKIYYDSGRVTVSNFKATLAAGKYYLVFDNKPGWAARAVQVFLYY